MGTYTVTAAFNVCCYIEKEIEAETEEEAKTKLVALAQDDALWSDWSVDYGSADEHRIILLADEAGNCVLEDIGYESSEWEELKTP
jgi:hypothetical protein